MLILKKDKLEFEKISVHSVGLLDAKKWLMQAVDHKINVENYLISHNETRVPTPEQRDIFNKSVKAIEALSTSIGAIITAFNSIPCQNLITSVPEASTQLKKWSSDFRKTTQKVDDIMLLLAQKKISTANVERNLTELSTYWVLSQNFLKSNNYKLSLQERRAKAVYYQETLLMAEMARFSREVLKRTPTPSDMYKIETLGFSTSLIGNVADSLMKN